MFQFLRTFTNYIINSTKCFLQTRNSIKMRMRQFNGDSVHSAQKLRVYSFRIHTYFFQRESLLHSTASQTFFLELHVIFTTSKHSSNNRCKSQQNSRHTECTNSFVQWAASTGALCRLIRVILTRQEAKASKTNFSVCHQFRISSKSIQNFQRWCMQTNRLTDRRPAYIRSYPFVSRASCKEHAGSEVEKCIHGTK